MCSSRSGRIAVQCVPPANCWLVPASGAASVLGLAAMASHGCSHAVISALGDIPFRREIFRDLQWLVFDEIPSL